MDLSGLRIVFVGKRRAALETARRLGLEVLLWSEKPPSPSEADVVLDHLPFDPATPLEGVGETARALRRRRPIAAVIALTEGTVRAAAALREALGVAGTSLATARLCADKQLMKEAVSAAGIRCARFAAAADGLSRDGLIETLGLPIVLKPRIGWGGRGARVLRERSEVPDGVPDGMLAESFVEGREMSVEALVCDGTRIFTNPTEYLEVGWANLVPARVRTEQRRAIEALLDRVLPALEVRRGIVHLELFQTRTGPVFGEIAARPPGGYILRLVELAYGFDLWEAWLRLELGDRPEVVPRAKRFAAVRLLYPGEGTVAAVHGLEEARALPGVVEALVRVKPGKELPPRVGVGQEAGRLMTVDTSRDAAASTLDAACRLVRIELRPPER